MKNTWFQEWRRLHEILLDTEEEFAGSPRENSIARDSRRATIARLEAARDAVALGAGKDPAKVLRAHAACMRRRRELADGTLERYRQWLLRALAPGEWWTLTTRGFLPEPQKAKFRQEIAEVPIQRFVAERYLRRIRLAVEQHSKPEGLTTK